MDVVPADVRRLVVAARKVAFEDQSREALKELDAASEAFADRVPWDDEPITAEHQLNNLVSGLAQHDSDCSVHRGCGCDCGAHKFARNVARE